MQTTRVVAVRDRFLALEGVASSAVQELLRLALPTTCPVSARLFFVGYSEFDVPVGSRFEVVFRLGHSESMVKAPSQLLAVSQQWGKPYDEVPYGHKTLCVIDFPEGTPSLVESLPVIDAWAYSPSPVCISTLATWQAQSQLPT